VEALAIRQFPGMKHLWRLQHAATPMQKETAGDYLDRLARALLDEAYQDDDPWISQGRALFVAADDLENNNTSRDIGLTLAHAFQQKKIRFNSRTDKLSAPYRDDNRF
jgi:nitric oxide reductase NorD protein